MVINDRELVFECECDFSAVFSHLSKLPKKRKIEFENILILADKLIILIPPEKLKKIADFDVKKLIEEDLISNFHSPRHLNMKFVQSDWVLIRNKNMKLFMPIKINIKISPTVFQSNVRNIFQNFFLSPFIRNNYLFFQKFIVLKKLKFRKIFLKKNSRVAKEYSYEGPFENNSLKFNPRTFFSINNQLNHIYHDNNQFVALKKVAINLSFIATTTMENFQIFDDRLYSIEILFLTATILAGFSGGYYYCI